MNREEAWRRTKGYLYDSLSGEEADEIIKTLDLNRDIEEIKEVINCEADAEAKCRMISNILTSKPHFFEKQEPCEDCISRVELLKAIDTWDKFGLDDTNHLFRLDNLSLPHYVPYIHYDDVVKCIKGMPKAEQEPKTGHWINATGRPKGQLFKCSVCGKTCNCVGIGARNKKIPYNYCDYEYCPRCMTKMNVYIPYTE